VYIIQITKKHIHYKGFKSFLLSTKHTRCLFRQIPYPSLLWIISIN